MFEVVVVFSDLKSRRATYTDELKMWAAVKAAQAMEDHVVVFVYKNNHLMWSQDIFEE